MPRLQEGIHVVTVVDAYMTESQGGTPGLSFKFENLEGYSECTRWVTVNTVDRVIKDLETMGMPSAKLSDIANIALVKQFVEGHEVKIVVEDEEFRGQSVPKVKWINEVGAQRKEDPQLQNRLFALLNGREAPMMSAPRAPKPSATQGPPLDDSDCPF